MKVFTKRAILAACVGAAMLITVGCGSNQNAQNTQLTYNGSSTLAPVISKIATDFTEKNKTWNHADSSLPDKDITIYVSSGGSGTGIKAVIDGTADFGLVAREVKDSEKAKIKDYNEIKVGIDALTIAVNPENPLYAVKDNLTKEEIIKIFSGEYKTWNQVDPSLPNQEIIVVTRDLGGGAHEVFQQKIMGSVEVTKDAIQAPSMGALVTKVKENPYAIGYASYGMLGQNKGQIVAFKVNGVAPTDETITDGSYMIQRPLLIVGKGNMGGVADAFTKYLKSEEGRKVIHKMGFVPVN
jgi:putative phosphate ABC transporter substrate-binding protein